MQITSLLWSMVITVIGFVMLIKGADWFVDGASSIARKLHVSGLVIGLTVVAIGTSLPELSVSVTSAYAGSSSLSYSNVIGSNIFNLIPIIGITAMIKPLPISTQVLKKELPFNFAVTILLAVLGFIGMSMGRGDGAILLIGVVYYLIRTILSAKKEQKEHEAEEQTGEMSVAKSIVFILIGAALVKFGGDFVVDGATGIARYIGLSETLIGLTIVALGTSLPELVTSVVAATKNEVDMALGNVVGSSVFNILGILGVASTLQPIAILPENLYDTLILLGMMAVVWIFGKTRKVIDKREGLVLTMMYIIYLIYIILR